MEKIKLFIGDGQTDNNIKLPYFNTFTVSNEELKDYVMKDNLVSYVNSPINGEKNIFVPKLNYNIKFFFYSGSYAPSFTSKFFIESDLTKNVFKKSSLVLEYLTLNDIEKADRYSMNVLSPVFDVRNNRGVSSYNEAFYNINSPDRENYNFYYYTNLINYVSLYVRGYFLNAKDGKIYNFVNDNNVNIDNIGDDKYLYEMRLYPDNTYQYFKNNIAVENLHFFELNI